MYLTKNGLFFHETLPLLFVYIPKQAKKIFISPQTIFLSINVKMGIRSRL